jgi:hypothetical protein
MNRAQDQLNETVVKARDLLEMWDRLARAHTMIGGAGCSCGIGGVVVALEDFEQEIAGYLQAEAERLNRHDVLKYLSDQAREGDLWSISKLLFGLTQSTGLNNPGPGTFVLERLTRTLQSFENLHGAW